MTDDRVDPERWVRLKADRTPDPQLRWFIRHNSHTHRGRFHVCAEGLDEHRTVNLGDVVELSPTARVWLDGFLAGQEIDMWEFLGRSDELLEAEEAEPETVERWERYNARLREKGQAGYVDSLPPADATLNELLAPTPWVFVGGRYRVWDGRAWGMAEPQPVLTGNGAFWPGSICAVRRHCTMVDAGDYSYCEDCHHVRY